MRLILASGSKNRQDILNMIGLQYEIIKSDIEEYSEALKPEEYVKELSKNKADNVAKRVGNDAIIIAADTILYKDDKKYEKPTSLEEAANNLRELSNSSCFATTGLTVKDLYNNKEIVISVTSEIILKSISEEDISWYLEDKYILERCGFSILGKGGIFIKEVIGDYNNIFGLPISKLHECFKELGYELKDFETKEQ